MSNVIYNCPVISGGTAYVSSPFGVRTDPISGKESSPHYGIDLQDALTWSGVDILAPADGIVTEIRDDCTWRWIDTRSLSGITGRDQSGNYVILNHGGGFVTVYKHLELGKVYVNVGNRVKAGTPLGRMGTSGYSTGVHLHFEVRKDGTQVDPEPYLAGIKQLPIIECERKESDGMDNIPAEWAQEAVDWAIDNGLIYGDDNGNLMLHEPLTREQMVVFLYRLYHLIVG